VSSQADRRGGGPAAAPGRLRRRTTRSSFVRDLRVVLAERNFRRLFATRLISQTGDGVFTAGLGSYVFFNATKYPDPASAAGAFAVLYLPYSLIGPFAGVFIDRWSRRQILVWSAVIRAAFVALTASLVASGNLGVPLYASVLLVLGVDRFFLSSLSAALPHVVAGDKLVIANSVAPTAGGIMASIGGLAALGVHLMTGSGQGGSAITLLAAGACYVMAGLVAATMRRELLGPNRTADEPVPGRVLAELAAVAAGLAAGARYLWRRRGPAAALGATGGNRFLYGILFLMSLLLYRNYFYRLAGANAALGSYSLLVAASAVGYASAAFVTPAATRRLAKPTWIAILLAAAAVVTGPLGATFSPLPFLIIGFALNLVSQGVAICSTTIIQEQVDDAYRGRVFAFYDMMFNVTFVAGAAISAAFMPTTGKSLSMVIVVATGYLLAAAGYRVVSRQPAGGGAGGTSGPPSPSAAAQASSS
jgi:MFS family permease